MGIIFFKVEILGSLFFILMMEIILGVFFELILVIDIYFF